MPREVQQRSKRQHSSPPCYVRLGATTTTSKTVVPSGQLGAKVGTVIKGSLQTRQQPPQSVQL